MSLLDLVEKEKPSKEAIDEEKEKQLKEYYS